MHYHRQMDLSHHSELVMDRDHGFEEQGRLVGIQHLKTNAVDDHRPGCDGEGAHAATGTGGVERRATGRVVSRQVAA